jgi:Mn2+/Fe2+ NRAMP family transporter
VGKAGAALDGTGPARRRLSPAPRRALALAAVFAALGPGVLAMAGDNDAGGLLAYSATGARFGTRFFLFALVLLGLVTLAVQDMATRLAIGTGEGLPELVGRLGGRAWARVLAADLALVNTATLVAELTGMAVGLAHFGLPLPLGILASLAAVTATLALGSYRSAERIGLSLVAINLLFLPLALTHLPAPAARLPWPAARALARPGFALFAVGLAGNAIAPWMPFFQMDAVHAHGWTAPSDLRRARLDLALGTAVQVLVAAAVLALSARAPWRGPFAPGPWLVRLGRSTSPWVADLFAAGLFDAGFVACLAVSYTSAWTVLRTWGGVGGAGAVPGRSRAAFALFALGLAVAGLLVALPGAPLGLYAVATQALSAVLMPPVLAVLWFLARRRRLVGALANGRGHDLVAALALVLFVAASGALLWGGS